MGKNISPQPDCSRKTRQDEIDDRFSNSPQERLFLPKGDLFFRKKTFFFHNRGRVCERNTFSLQRKPFSLLRKPFSFVTGVVFRKEIHFLDEKNDFLASFLIFLAKKSIFLRKKRF